jgi:hypothetical protein
LIIKSLKDLQTNEEELSKELGLKPLDKIEPQPLLCYREWRDAANLSGWWKYALNPYTWLRYRIESIGIGGWKVDPTRVEAEQLWTDYRVRATVRNRFHRLLPMTVTYVVLGILLVLILGLPHTPHRGNLSWIVDKVLLFFSVCSMIILVFFVVDATSLSVKFIRNLKGPHTIWPDESVEHYRCKKSNEGHNDKQEDGIAEWLDIRFIASHTQAVGKLIYWPFIVLLIMFVARNPYFDNWDFPAFLIAIFLMNSGYALVCASILRREAEKTREIALDRLQKKLVEARAQCDECPIKHIEILIDEIKSVRQGAYSPFTENPVLHAILIPSGGVSLLTLLRFLPVS